MTRKASGAGKSEVVQLARGFSLLSDSTRLGILKMLESGPKNVTAMCDGLGLKQPAVSHHLGLMREGGLVAGKRQGKSVIYSSDASVIKDLAASLVKLSPSKGK